MKALTLWQPWASLVVAGAKTYETRSWPTHHSGTIAIHAARRAIDSALDWVLLRSAAEILRNNSAGQFYLDDVVESLPRGAIIGTVRIVGCESTEWTVDHVGINEADRLFGDWTPGRFAWRLKQPRALPIPIHCRGFQGLWRVTDDIPEAP